MPGKMDLGALVCLGGQPAVAARVEDDRPDRIVEIRNGRNDKRSARKPLHVAGPDIGKSDSNASKPSGFVQYDLLLLRRECETWDRIANMIEGRHWSCGSFFDLPALCGALKESAKLILIDACFLSQITQQSHGAQLREAGAPPMLFISEHCDILTRIEAIQAGGHRLYMEPINLNALMTEIEVLLHPENEPNNRVLVIGQEVSMAGPIVDLLQKYGIEYLLLTDPLAAIDTIWQFRPDLILMQDIASDTLDNRVLIRLIREREESVAIPVVLLTEDKDPDNRLRLLQAGADDVLTSPTPPQQLLTVISCRIARTQDITTSGVLRSFEHPGGEMWDRQRLIRRLEQLCTDGEEGEWFYGVIVIALELNSFQVEHSQGNISEPDQVKLGDVLRPILQAQDVLSWLDARHVAVLVRRVRKQELEQAEELIREMLRYRQETEPGTCNGFSVGLAMLDKGNSGSEAWLRQAEDAAEQAANCIGETRSGYPMPSSPPDRGVREGTEWLREGFLQALEGNSITLQERRYQSLQAGLSAVRTIELIPRMHYPGMGEDIYQQAAVHGASADVDKLICKLAINRLYDYTQQGKAVRLILRQSVAVVAEAGYIEHIKSVLRRLQIVGQGLVLEFSLPQLATRLRDATILFDQLAALGITASLSHFPGGEIGYKALERLNVGVIRPRSALLYEEPEKIERLANRVRSRKVDIILPVVDDADLISPIWFECADCVQEGVSMIAIPGDLHRPSEGLWLPPV